MKHSADCLCARCQIHRLSLRLCMRRDVPESAVQPILPPLHPARCLLCWETPDKQGLCEKHYNQEVGGRLRLHLDEATTAARRPDPHARAVLYGPGILLGNRLYLVTEVRCWGEAPVLAVSPDQIIVKSGRGILVGYPTHDDGNSPRP